MKPLGNQFEDIINKVMPKALKQVAMQSATLINKQMHVNVDAGKDFAGKAYPKYAQDTARRRRKIGLSGSLTPVTLQRIEKNIKLAEIKIDLAGKSEAVATIKFQGKPEEGKYSWGQIFNFHHEGMGRNPERNIFPKQAQHVPSRITKTVKTIGAEVLNEPIK